MRKSAPITERRYLVPFVLVTSLFFLWAIGVNLNDILFQHLKKALGLTSDASNIQYAFIVPLICHAYVFYFAFSGYKPLLAAEAAQ